MFVSIEDFRRADTTIDWKAYRDAQKQNGEICTQCSRTIIHVIRFGEPQRCPVCISLAKPEEVYHHCYIRCPHCGYPHDVQQMDGCDYGDELYTEGIHSLVCFECDTEFEFETQVSITYKSPSLVPESNTKKE